MEPERTYSFRVDTGAQNESGAITLSALQRILVTVSEEHLENIDLDVPRLMKNYGVSWILLSMTVEIKSSILAGEKLTVKTWHTNKKGAYYRRDIEISHENGEVAAVAATFSSIFDMSSRRLCTNDAVLETVTELGCGRELFDASPRIHIDPKGLPVVLTEKVMPSWIDALGHTNNFRYGDLITDALSEESRKKLKQLKRFELGFTGELRLGDSVELRVSEENETVLAAGIRSSDQKPAFLAKLYF